MRVRIKSLPHRVADALGWKLESVWGMPLHTLRIWVKTDVEGKTTREGLELSLELATLIEQGVTSFKQP